MDSKKVVSILLIVAIVFSVISIVLGLGVDLGSYVASDVDCSELVECVGPKEDSGSGRISLQVLPAGSG